jgi:hypothetical protein
MVEQGHVADAQNLRGVLQFMGTDGCEIGVGDQRRIADGALLATRRAQQHHPRARVRQPGDRPSARQRLVVWMRKDDQDRAAGEISGAGSPWQR